MPRISFKDGLWWVWLAPGSPWGFPGATAKEAWNKYKNWLQGI